MPYQRTPLTTHTIRTVRKSERARVTRSTAIRLMLSLVLVVGGTCLVLQSTVWKNTKQEAPESFYTGVAWRRSEWPAGGQERGLAETAQHAAVSLRLHAHDSQLPQPSLLLFAQPGGGAAGGGSRREAVGSPLQHLPDAAGLALAHDELLAVAERQQPALAA
jgi:hypothetical protein